MSPADRSTRGDRSARAGEIGLALVVFVLVGTWFAWAADSVFKADDYPAIDYARDLGRVAHDFVGPQYDLSFFLFWRPWITTSLSIDHALFGTNPAGYYWMNAFAFCASVFLVWSLLRTLVPERPMWAWGVAILWLVHPAPVVSLHWVVGRVDTHSVFPMLLACVLHLHHRRGGRRWPVVLALIWSFASKESAIGLPLVLLGLDLLDRHPCLVRAPHWFGRGVPALLYLAALPLFFLWRYIVLGDALGGYGFLELQEFSISALIGGLRQSLGQTIVPGAPDLVRDGVVLLLVAVVGVWSLRARRGPRIAGVLLVSAGLWGPLAQLLPSMRDPSQQRYAYAACLWTLCAWAGAAAMLSGTISNRTVRSGAFAALLVLPIVLLVPERAREVAKLDEHDAFCRAFVQCVDDARASDGPMPIVVAGDAERVNHPQRFLWGLGAVHAPPFRETGKDIVTLRKLVPYATPVPTEFATTGAPHWIHVGPRDTVELREGSTGTVTESRPVGFAGLLTRGHWQVLENPDARLGYECGPTTEIHVMTSVGSAVLRVAPRDGVLRVRDVLLADLGWATGSGVVTSLIYLLLNPLDLAPKSPVYLMWREETGVRVATLHATKGFVRRAIEALR